MDKTIDMAQEAQISDTTIEFYQQELKAFEALVRADERNSWPAEMEAMERQVNILTDALADEREKAKHNEEVLMNALWKACGDDGQLVEATIESQGELK
jgi:hypothetical protein